MEPVIKVRYKRLLCAFIAILQLTGATQVLPKCNKMPLETASDKYEGDNGFAVLINGSPRLYRPNQIYTLTIRNIGEMPGLKFQGFMLVVEAAQGNTAIQAGLGSLGTLNTMPGDAMVKFSHRCSHSVEATSSISKEEVQVYWTAPPRGSGCIDFKAMVEERKDVWYSDEGSLTYTLCEDDSPLAEPPVYSPCCACDEAKYEMIFEGIWSRHTHPKDFPPDEWRTEFSQIIGASHSWNYSLWEYGRQSSPALQLLGEKGITTRLEGEMKRYSPFIRSVIKAHGLQQRSNVAGQTFAVFRVDPQHHLLSFVSKMIPSPDWIVGLSKENLCNADCTWVPNRVIDLYPWDVGTESGLRYDSPPSPQRPRAPIQRITSSNPNNPESPFFDPTSAPMKPAARLHIIRQREYRKACPPGGRRSQKMNPNPSWTGGGGADMGLGNSIAGGPESYSGPESSYRNDYGTAGGNSYMYGTGGNNNPGLQSGQYGYNDPSAGAGLGGHNSEDMYNQGGYGANYGYGNQGGAGGYGGYNQGFNPPEANQERPSEEDEEEESGGLLSNFLDRFKDDPCQLNEWEEWTPCSKSCGRASRHRQRSYSNPEDAQAESCQEKVMEKEPCRLPKCPGRTYGGVFMPFGTEEQSSGSSYWSDRGLKSDGLQAPVNSYTYETGRNYPAPPGPNYGSNSRYGRYYQGDDPMEEPETALVNDYGGDDFGNSYIYGGLDDQGNVDMPQYSQLNSAPQENSRQNCQVTQWGDWSDCSTSCGSGRRTRTRRYVFLEHSAGCSEELDDVEPCIGDHSSCPEEDLPQITGLGFGRYGSGSSSSSSDDSDVSNDGTLITDYYASGSNHNPFAGGQECAVAEWSEWSPCSRKCAMGTRLRTRLFLIPFVEGRTCDVRLIDKERCYGDDRSCSDPHMYKARAGANDDEMTISGSDVAYDFVDNLGHNNDYNTYDDYSVENRYDELETLNQHQAYPQEQFNPASAKKNQYDHICNISPDEGPCSGFFHRWHYDPKEETCKKFIFRGCNGNRNNFPSEARCMEVCGSRYGKANWRVDDISSGVDNGPFRTLKALSSVKMSEGEITRNSWRDPTIPPIDCQVSAWSAWSDCSVSCGIGWLSRERHIMVAPSHGGRACPKKLIRRKRCKAEPCPVEQKYFYQGSWRHMVSNRDIRPDN